MDPLRKLSRHLRERYGIAIDDAAAPLVRTRLREYALSSGDGDVDALVERVVSAPVKEDIREISGFVLNSHSFFYREPAHFDFLAKHALPDLDERYLGPAGGDLRVWSAGSAEGDEAYSLVMVMREHFGARYERMRAGVLATDISLQALARGMAADYAVERFRLLPPVLRNRFIEASGPGRGRVVEAVRGEVLFRWLNLLDPTNPFKGKFHVIFCRNVMVYFDEAVQARVCERLAKLLAPGGYLFIGHTDNAAFARRHLRPVRPSIFQSA